VRQAAGWDKLPNGWTQDSVKKFWSSLTGEAKHKVTKCIERMKAHMEEPGGFCASLADQVDPGWRSRKAFGPDATLTPLRAAWGNLQEAAQTNDEMEKGTSIATALEQIAKVLQIIKCPEYQGALRLAKEIKDWVHYETVER